MSNFVSMLAPQMEDIDNSYVFIADSANLLIKMNNKKVTFPEIGDFGPDITKLDRTEYLGTLGGIHCFCLSLEDDLIIPDGIEFIGLRKILKLFDSGFCSVAYRAVHIANWTRKSRYCGACGNKTEKSSFERARVCKSCGNIIYPRISPAIIISVIKNGKILLAHNRRFPGNFFGLIAGFIEPGETFEDAAKREVLEEVGLEIKNIRYVQSQPWPFPDSLMIGLTAEYAGGEIRPDGEEIDKAGWYGADELPNIPDNVSIAGRLIERFAQENK